MTPEDIDKMPAGREMDALVAEKVIGWSGIFWLDKEPTGAPPNSHAPYPVHIKHYSTRFESAGLVFDKLALLVGGWKYCDGFATLVFAESANHSDARHECGVNDGQVRDEEGDYTRHWSCHFHIGSCGISDSPEIPDHWKVGDKFCAMGETAMLAICRAALKAVTQ